MKQKHQSVFLAGLLALAVGLSACSSWRGGGMGSSGSSGTSGETGSSGTATGTSSSSGSSGSSGTSGTSGSSSAYDSSGTSGTAGMSGSSGMMQERGANAAATTPNATVAAIEVMPRSGGTTMDGETAGAMGSSAGGTTGSSPDRVYRITLRMDDGSTQVVTQQTTPDYRTGDRVSLAGGVIQH